MTTTLDLVRESGLPDEAVAELEPFVCALRELAPQEVPTPSPALAALMASPPGFRARSRRRLAAFGVAAAALSSMTVTGVAAAANELPASAQHFVAEFSQRYLPFHFPEPRHSATVVEKSPEPAVPVPNRIEPVSPDSGVAPSSTSTAGPAKPPAVVAEPSTSTSTSAPPPSSSPSPSPQQSAEPSPEPSESSSPSSAPTDPASVPPSAPTDPTTMNPDGKPSGGSSGTTGTPATAEPTSGPGSTAPATEPAGTT